MVTTVAPAYATLAMGYLEMHFYYKNAFGETMKNTVKKTGTDL